MDLDMALTLAQIISLGFVAPVAIFRVWRKLDERLTEQDRQLLKINYQLWENGGNSMKDQINCIKNDVNELKINQAVIKQKVGV